MGQPERRVIPGYEGYSVTQDGRIFSIERELELTQYLFNGYYIVDAFRNSLTETLPAHRAVALAWVDNPDPESLIVVNHLDGIPTNNHSTNLEWTDYSGNNYHAVNNGLRNDNINCRVREFPSGVVTEFASMAQAAAFMGLPKDTPYSMLSLKMFGALIGNRYEFRYCDDNTPWFFEGRIERTPVSRYWVVVTKPDGEMTEVWSNRSFLKEYQLYRCLGKSMPSLVEYARTLYPELNFTIRDSYTEVRHRTHRRTRPSRIISVRAICGDTRLDFASLTSCASHFGVDRSTIQNRINKELKLDGWLFIT